MQGDNKWHQERLGKFTASEIYKIMGAKGFGKIGETYIFDKVAEVLTGERAEIPENYAMQRGKELEPIAKDYYQMVFNKKISDIDFIKSLKFPDHVGASPDGITEFHGIEIKCPLNNANHVKYMMVKNASDLKKIEPKYYWQIVLNLYCSDLEYWEFISFSPNFKGKQRMYIVDIKPDAKDLELIENRLIEAIASKENLLSEINTF